MPMVVQPNVLWDEVSDICISTTLLAGYVFPFWPMKQLMVSSNC
jgi:hypothetical protein